MAAGALRRRNGFVALGRALFARGGPGPVRRLGAVPRMLAARFRGRYQGLSWGRLVAMVVGAIYVISPVDIVPEAFLLVFGLGDDGVVLAWLAGALLDEAERFLDWERTGRERAALPGPTPAPLPGPSVPGPSVPGPSVPGPSAPTGGEPRPGRKLPEHPR